MDATPAGSKKRPRSPAAEIATPPAQQVAEPAPPHGAAAGGEADDEQVERFFALLDRIRAMRCMFKAGGADTALLDTGRKRARAAGGEPPWRPAFRIEDFDEREDEDQADADDALAVCAGKRKEEEEVESRSGALGPTEGSEAAGTGGVAGDEEGMGEVVEAPAGPRRAPRLRRTC